MVTIPTLKMGPKLSLFLYCQDLCGGRFVLYENETLCHFEGRT